MSDGFRGGLWSGGFRGSLWISLALEISLLSILSYGRGAKSKREMSLLEN